MKDHDSLDGREYRGWKQQRWTGWKPRYLKTVVPPEGHRFDEKCPYCSQPLLPGQEINRQQNGDAHWACSNPEDAPNYYMGQWVFYKPAAEIKDYKYCFVNVPPAGEGLYERGTSFDVTGAQNIVMAETSDEEKERLKAEGLQRMYEVIDELESVAA